MLVQVDHLHLWGRTAHRKLFCRLVNQHRSPALAAAPSATPAITKIGALGTGMYCGA
jgi:hypothetical protein